MSEISIFEKAHGFNKGGERKVTKFPSLRGCTAWNYGIARNPEQCGGGLTSGPGDRQEWANVFDSKIQYRKLTVTECERLQTLPDGYTEGVSNTQRYKMLGNGWTREVIAHIFSYLKKGSAHD